MGSMELSEILPPMENVTIQLTSHALKITEAIIRLKNIPNLDLAMDIFRRPQARNYSQRTRLMVTRLNWMASHEVLVLLQTLYMVTYQVLPLSF